MISATPTGSQHSHSHPPGPNQRGLLGVGTDSQKFLVPSLPVSTRFGNDMSSKKRDPAQERSIVNGIGHTNQYHQRQYQQPRQQQNPGVNVNGVKRYELQHQDSGSPNTNHFHAHGGNAGRGKQHAPHHHQSDSPNKDPTVNPLYYHHNAHINGAAHAQAQAQQLARYQRLPTPTNPTNYHRSPRASMPVPCSSPAAASSASPKSASPATNGIQLHNHNNSGRNSYSPQSTNNVSSHPHGDLNLSSPLRFYPGGLPHPGHQMSFFAAAAAAAAAAGQHHGLPYSLFPSPYAHSAAATSYLDNFHSSLLAQQQQEHLKNMGPSPSPPARPMSAGFPSRSPIASPNISPASLYTKYHGGAPEPGSYSATNHGRINLDNVRNIQQQQHENDNMRFASMLCSGLSKGGPLGVGVDSSNFPRMNHNHIATNPFMQNEESSSSKLFNDERNSNANGISSKFWNIDGESRGKRELEGKQKKTGQHSNQPNEANMVSMANNNSFMNGKDGSLKHRILTRSPDPQINSPIKHKMAETVFTFPEHASEAYRKFPSSLVSNHDRRNISESFLLPSPTKRSNGQSMSMYPSLGMSDVHLHPVIPRPSGAATTITTDSAKYLTQMQKPPMNMKPSMSSLDTSPSMPMSPYLSQNMSVQNLSSSLAAALVQGPSQSQKSRSIPPSPTTPTALNLKKQQHPPGLPLDQMPEIQAFRKGSLIQLASGQLRPVEDLRIEDFHRAAATMVDSLRIVYCKIVEIEANPVEQCFKVTLAVGGVVNHQVVMSASPVQPFFVVGRGWASCSPEMTEKILQLGCTSLNVGDVCITLTKMSRAKAGRSGAKPATKNGATKCKTSTNSILSTPPRRGSASTSYASRILKVPNGGIAKPTTVSKLKGNSSPKSPTKVRFEQNQLKTNSPSTSTIAMAGPVTSFMLPPPNPTPIAESSDVKTQSDTAAALPVKEKESICEERQSSAVTPKKRRWSAPDAVNDPEDEPSKDVKQPKRPISHSPISFLP